ncbi:MAG TPA: RNA-guided endonuclease TnpB family protein [Ktedonobacterales bacterium]|nr:RNA-guided endonuclease TnpB family protein [Ktedonobacterales bacterium]
MLVTRAYKTELDLNNEQVTACKQHAGAARFAYNWGLKRKQERYKATGKSPYAMELHRELNALKKTDLPWMYSVSKCAPQEALRNLDSAFAHFFQRCQLKREGKFKGKVGYPCFKSRKCGLGSFRLTGTIVVYPAAIQLPRLGCLRLKERGYLPTTGVKVLSATVSEAAGHWYVSMQVEQEQASPQNAGPVIGVDLGVKSLATFSDGTVISNPRHLKRRLKKIKRFHRAVSRKQQGSKNRKKAAHRLARLYRKAAHQRQNTLHQLTAMLAKTKQVIVIENLNVNGMLKNHHLAQSIADVGFGEFRRQLVYKAAWYGSRVVLADRWYASSKTCSGCGWVDEDLELSDRLFHCRNPLRVCGLVMDRDLNAAMNLAMLAASSADTVNACGEERSGVTRKPRVKRASQAGQPEEAGTKRALAPRGIRR